MLRIGEHVCKKTGQKNLCMAGGGDLNCEGNGILLMDGPLGMSGANHLQEMRERY